MQGRDLPPTLLGWPCPLLCPTTHGTPSLVVINNTQSMHAWWGKLTITSPSGAMRLTVLPSLVISGMAIAAPARPRRRKARMTAGSGLRGGVGGSGCDGCERD